MASFFVRKSGKSGWIVLEQSYDKGKSIQKTVPKLSYQAIGINPEWSLSQAKKEIKLLNKQNAVQRKNQRKIVTAAKRYQEMVENDSAFLPVELVKEFDEKIAQDSFGSEDHIKRLHSHWKCLQNLIKTLKLKPDQHFDNKKRIYRYFANHSYSNDYCNKLLRMLNEWGYFWSVKSASLFRPVPAPRGVARELIAKEYRVGGKSRKPSNPITPRMLLDNKTRLIEENYNWLFISVWFGLRPEEVDNLNSATLTITQQSGKQILHIYQSKLVTLPEEDRWKFIPCLYPEQLEALEVIKSGKRKRPTPKTMRTVFGKGTGVYGGRKGFVDLMLDRGQTLEDTSMWLGHQSIETTWRKYRNRRRVSWKAG